MIITDIFFELGIRKEERKKKGNCCRPLLIEHFRWFPGGEVV